MGAKKGSSVAGQRWLLGLIRVAAAAAANMCQHMCACTLQPTPTAARHISARHVPHPQSPTPKLPAAATARTSRRRRVCGEKRRSGSQSWADCTKPLPTKDTMNVPIVICENEGIRIPDCSGLVHGRPGAQHEWRRRNGWQKESLRWIRNGRIPHGRTAHVRQHLCSMLVVTDA